MTTEQKIREAFETKFAALDFTQDKDAWGVDKYQHPYVQCLFDGFRTGYLALLNSLERIVVVPELYALPEGVTKDD